MNKEKCVICQDGFTVKRLAEEKIEKLAILDFPVCKKHILEICQYLQKKKVWALRVGLTSWGIKPATENLTWKI